ncbi:MAG: carbohydrate binding family 9 domain-containing protein [Flavobacteriaceae bacterium]|nr:carbohydrate binding family 9 domain-containing protein [Flavobacteriaceae bacterium]
MNFFSSFLLFFVFFSLSTYSQKKTLQAKSTVENIAIDGKIDEEAWKTASIATDFIMFEPDNGEPISENKKSEVKVLYDNTAIYISAVLYDDAPNKISRELTNRDGFGVCDNFSVSINGNNDGQQDFRFFVSAAGVQMDCLATESLENFNWDAIWDSKVKITDFGWVVEMKIPYAALRFSKAAKQTWGLNFKRDIKRGAQDQSYTWNFVDTKIGSVITQEGILEGIENIKTPTRLFFIPYTSAYYQQDDYASDKTLKAGMDIKYGINDAFTLDAILVPDFGQTKFDNAILNLEPFEQQLNENRPFFTEATDLFSKGNLFYSRRIGGSPTNEPTTGVDEVVTEYPSSTDLLNAVKVSGRTEKGLGIGFLNAITEKTYAKILDTTTNETRKEVIQPLTNYNVLVLDQRFNQNSSVTFLNTSTLRAGGFRDANVSAVLFDLNTKANTHKLSGDFKYSSITGLDNYNGFKTAFNFAKTSGKYRYLFSGKYISGHYDVNDLGLIYVNNYHAGYGEITYRIVNPTKMFNSFKINQNINVETQNTTGKAQEAWYQAIMTATTIKNNYLEGKLQINPVDRYNFYEPRVYGRYVYVPKSVLGYAQFYSNDNKPFHYEIEGYIEKFDEENRNTYTLDGGIKYRFNDKLSLSYNILYTRKVNDRGYVAVLKNNDIIFGERNREIVEHYFTGKYSINDKMTFNLIARYYWAYSENHEFFTLQNDGHLTPNSTYSINKNRNLNSWNLDFSYSWWFAPGSEFSVLYRNYALESTNLVQKNMSTNLSNVFDANLTSIFSISIRYYIDYNSLRKKR